MTMRTATSPRKLYKRAGSFLLLVTGQYYGPLSGKKSKFDAKVEVTHEALKPHGGKQRIEVAQVTQVDGKDVTHKEVWIEREVVFNKRAPKVEPAADAGLLDAAPEAPAPAAEA